MKKLAKSSTSVVLSDGNGPLCIDVLSSSIREANLEVLEILETAGKRKPYLKVSPEKKAIIGKYAAENGSTETLNTVWKCYKGRVPQHSVRIVRIINCPTTL